MDTTFRRLSGEWMTPRRRFLSALYGGRVDKVPAMTLSSVMTLEAMEIADAAFPEAHLDAEKMARLAATAHENHRSGHDHAGVPLPVGGCCPGRMMLRGGGFTVIDLGVYTSPDEFLEAVRTKGARIVGMSALLTTTMPNMARTVEAFKDASLREHVRFMVGGAPVTPEFGRDAGADGYGKDALSCVELAKELAAEVGL